MEIGMGASLFIAAAGVSGFERYVPHITVCGLLAAACCWVAAAVGFHLHSEARKAAAVWVLLPPTMVRKGVERKG